MWYSYTGIAATHARGGARMTRLSRVGRARVCGDAQTRLGQEPYDPSMSRRASSRLGRCTDAARAEARMSRSRSLARGLALACAIAFLLWGVACADAQARPAGEMRWALYVPLSA